MSAINLSEIRVSDFTQKIESLLPVINEQPASTDYQGAVISYGIAAIAWVEIKL